MEGCVCGPGARRRDWGSLQSTELYYSAVLMSPSQTSIVPLHLHTPLSSTANCVRPAFKKDDPLAMTKLSFLDISVCATISSPVINHVFVSLREACSIYESQSSDGKSFCCCASLCSRPVARAHYLPPSLRRLQGVNTLQNHNRVYKISLVCIMNYVIPLDSESIRLLFLCFYWLTSKMPHFGQSPFSFGGHICSTSWQLSGAVMTKSFHDWENPEMS